VTKPAAPTSDINYTSTEVN